MSPTSRRRRSDPTLDDASAHVGTRLDEPDDPLDVAVPDEPEWLRDAAASARAGAPGSGAPGSGEAGNTSRDPGAQPSPVADPAAIAARRAARAEEIVRAIFMGKK